MQPYDNAQEYALSLSRPAIQYKTLAITDEDETQQFRTHKKNALSFTHGHQIKNTQAGKQTHFDNKNEENT